MSHIVDDKDEEQSIKDLLRSILTELKINNEYLLIIVDENNKINAADIEIQEIL